MQLLFLVPLFFFLRLKTPADLFHPSKSRFQRIGGL
uniref:Uncharacterized protein n=1 Tax=Setaria viridis TaxID=4556 RepID=A0A4U6TLL5_SETVI|nr:hypothetical protein SEVIR_9G550550v2 [Setaria viridis]